MSRRWSVWAFGALFMVMGWHGQAAAKVRVFVSILPQKQFVERIGGDRVDVSVLVSPGESPATYRPKPSLVAKLGAAKLYFRIGVPFEEHLLPKLKSTAKALAVVDTRKGVRLRDMDEGEDEGHHKGREGHDEDGEDHEEEGHHHGEGSDPHIWLDPMRVKIQARTICDALIKTDPDGRELYERGYAGFASELDAVHQDLLGVLAPIKGGELYVFHPSFGYFAEAYGLVQRAVEVEGKRPKGRELARFIQKAREERVRVIFVQPQFDRHTAQKIAHAIGGSVVAIDPLAEDFLSNLRGMASLVRQSLMKK